MMPIYKNKKLTNEEVVHLTEFFKLVEGEQEKTHFKFLVCALILLIVFVFLVQIIWHDRLQGVLKGLLKKAKKENK